MFNGYAGSGLETTFTPYPPSSRPPTFPSTGVSGHAGGFRAGYPYLEEDCDAEVFLKAYEERNGRRPMMSSHFDEASGRIREMTPF